MVRNPPSPHLLLAIGTLAVAGCVVRVPVLVPWPPPASSASRGPDARGGRAVSADEPRRSTGAPPRSALYSPDEAVSDAMSGPLEIVGVGEWPGVFRRLSCAYRNDRVFVVDERCSDPREPNGLLVHVLSPERGRATIFAEAGRPIGAARRAAYESFGVASAAPLEPPASLSLAMGYEELIAGETPPRGRIRPTCSASTQRPQGSCSKGAASTPEAFAASVAPFLREPPADWYALVGALVELRARAHAGIRPAALPTQRLAAWGASWGRDQEITVAEAAMKRVGNAHGRSAAVALTADGGALIAGTTSHQGATVPAVVRADASGARRWLTPLPARGFVTHEEASVAALPDGAVVLSPGYPDPGWKPTARVIRLDDAGKVRWQWLGRGKDRHKIPQIVTAQPTPKGTILLRGYIQLVADGDVHEWTGELDGRGKALREEVGPVLPDHGASFE